MAEFSRNVWAPWRMEYIRSLEDEQAEGGCFLCRYWAEPWNDAKNHLIWRTERCFAVLNRFPYTNGHTLVATGAHKATMDEFDEQELDEFIRLTRDVVALLSEAIHPGGFNVGMNLGRCAGAGVPDHLHAHIVPRWEGDTNFMAVVGDVRVIPQSMADLYAHLREAARRAGLRAIAADDGANPSGERDKP